MTKRFHDDDRDVCRTDAADGKLRDAKIDLRRLLSGASLPNEHGLDSKLVGEEGRYGEIVPAGIQYTFHMRTIHNNIERGHAKRTRAVVERNDIHPVETD